MKPRGMGAVRIRRLWSPKRGEVARTWPSCQNTKYRRCGKRCLKFLFPDHGLPADNALGSLAGFNIGVEAGRLVIVLCCVPLPTLAWRALPERAVSAAGSLAIGVIGCVWAVERAL